MQSMTRLFFGSLPFPSALSPRNSVVNRDDGERRGVLRTVDCDHYSAIPISDGYHMLFTHPDTGLLCLGSDAPLGGPTKLTRKACMVPPIMDSSEKLERVVCYRAARNLCWGLRVVAAYQGGKVVFYNIPVDCFNRIRYLRSGPDIWDEMAGVLGQSDLMMDVFMADSDDGSSHLDHHNQCTSCEPRASSDTISSARAFRALQVDGQHIYTAGVEIEDIQVDCTGGGVSVWLFLQRGQAVKLSIYTPVGHAPNVQTFRQDGTPISAIRNPRNTNATAGLQTSP